MHRPSRFEALMWLGFSLGGFASAFLLPLHMLVSNVLLPLGSLGSGAEVYARFLAKLALPLTKVYLLVLLGRTLHHALHRFKFTLLELGLRHVRTGVSILFYVVEVVGVGALLAALLP